MAGLEEASDANLVVGVGRWHEPALAEVYRRHGGAVKTGHHDLRIALDGVQ